jgi:glutathione S-transferase
MLTLILANKNYSSWSLRGYLAAKLTGQPFDEITIALDRPESAAELAQHSPSGRVPVLRDGRLIIWDSLAIGEYLAEQFPHAGLWPKDPNDRARARSLAAEMHSGFPAIRSSYPFNAKRSAKRRTPAEPDVEAELARIDAIWSARRGPFMFGEFCLTDAFFAPMASRFRSYQVELKGGAADYAQALLAHPAVEEWHRLGRAETWSVPKYDGV